MDNCKCPEPATCEYCSRMYPCDCHGCPHGKKAKGAPLAQCQADAIAAVERWRDGIR